MKKFDAHNVCICVFEVLVHVYKLEVIIPSTIFMSVHDMAPMYKSLYTLTQKNPDISVCIGDQINWDLIKSLQFH